MQLSNIPGKLVLPFANAGGKNTIPVDSQIGITAGAASLVDGFPPLTRTPIAAGGVPPSGLDMNGIIYELSAVIRWANAGGGYPFDSAFATDTNVGGYPKGARIMRADGAGYWYNTTDNNVTDPESSGAAAAGWVPDFTTGVAAVTMTSANVTLTPAQYGKPVVSISGTLTANLNLIFPTIPGASWKVLNKTIGDFSITLKTQSGIGVIVENDSTAIVYCDGTDINAINSLNFVANGIGAVIRGYLDKAREIKTPKDFLPIGLNPATTECSAYIQDAIDALPTGGILDGLGATYLVKRCNLKSNMALVNFNFKTAPGAIPSEYWSPVTIGNNGDTSLYENILVWNTHVDGNRVNNDTGSVAYPEDGGKHGFRLIGNINNVSLINCSARYCGSYGFFGYRGLNTATIPFDDVATINNVRLIDCVSMYNKAHGGAFDSIQYLKIANGRFTHNGLAYGSDPAGMTLTGHAYGSGIDFEGYGIGSYIGEIDVIDTDLRHNGAKSVLVVDPVATSDPRFVIRNDIKFTDCHFDTGSDSTRFDPAVALQVTAPFVNWANGSIYEAVTILGGSVAGEIWFACVDNLIIDVNQIVTTGRLGEANYSNTVKCYTPLDYSFVVGFGADITYRRLVDYSTGTWTPNISSGSGTVTTYTSSGSYVKVGKLVTLTVKYTIVTNGSGASYGVINNLPFSANSDGGSGTHRVGGTSGKQCAVSVAANEAYIWQYDNTYPWADGATGSISISYITA